MLTSWLSIHSFPPPLLNSCLLSVLLAYLNKMGTFHRFLLILSVLSSVCCYNEEEEEAYLVVKPSISPFVNGSNIVQTPPTTRRPYNAPRMPDISSTTTRTTTGTPSTTSTTPSTLRTTTLRPTTTTSKPAFLPTINR
jgi:hypothetical protein